MKLHPRETMLAMVAGFVILFGITFVMARPKLTEWDELKKRREELNLAVEKDKKLLSKRGQWAKQFGELKQFLPEFKAEERMDTYWMKKMDETASKYGVVLTSRQASEEKRIGDVTEMPIDCREWEAEWSSLVRFLVDLQSQGAMLDVRQLLVKPKEKTTMRGRFLLYCAYVKPATAVKVATPGAAPKAK